MAKKRSPMSDEAKAMVVECLERLGAFYRRIPLKLKGELKELARQLEAQVKPEVQISIEKHCSRFEIVKFDNQSLRGLHKEIIEGVNKERTMDANNPHYAGVQANVGALLRQHEFAADALEKEILVEGVLQDAYLEQTNACFLEYLHTHGAPNARYNSVLPKPRSLEEEAARQLEQNILFPDLPDPPRSAGKKPRRRFGEPTQH